MGWEHGDQPQRRRGIQRRGEENRRPPPRRTTAHLVAQPAGAGLRLINGCPSSARYAMTIAQADRCRQPQRPAKNDAPCAEPDIPAPFFHSRAGARIPAVPGRTGAARPSHYSSRRALEEQPQLGAGIIGTARHSSRRALEEQPQLEIPTAPAPSNSSRRVLEEQPQHLPLAPSLAIHSSRRVLEEQPQLLPFGSINRSRF